MERGRRVRVRMGNATGMQQGSVSKGVVVHSVVGPPARRRPSAAAGSRSWPAAACPAGRRTAAAATCMVPWHWHIPRSFDSIPHSSMDVYT